jgi:hypothetical protein
MRALRQLIVVVLALAIIAGMASLAVVTGVTLLAFVAPFLGVSYLGWRSNAALELWRSHGRFQIGDGVRVIAAGRARVLAVLTILEGVAGFGLSLVPTFLVFGPHLVVVPMLGTAAATLMASRLVRRRVMEAAHPVDVLPPV